MIITGGGDPEVDIVQLVSVTVYGNKGWIEDLPNMQYRRTEHGCTSYLSMGKRVSLLYYCLTPTNDETLKIFFSIILFKYTLCILGIDSSWWAG